MKSTSGIAFLSQAVLAAALVLGLQAGTRAASGTEGAAFLDIPVGAAPASLGSAYTAMAADAYAPTWNPAGLGFLESASLAGQHLSYLESIQYEYLSFVYPFHKGWSMGGSIQYLGSGDITETNESGANIGSFSSHYASYNVAAGRAFSPRLSLGITGKLIDAKISDVGARAFAADLGAMYRARENLTLAATLTNLGSRLKFLHDGDALPMALHLGGAYSLSARWLASLEGVFRRNGLYSGHAGLEWRPIDMVALRAGYRTDTLKELGALAGLTTGIGLEFWGQEFAYAWNPYGDLGNTHYLSMVLRFGEARKQKWNLIHYNATKSRRVHNIRTGHEAAADPEYQQLMQLLNENDLKERFSQSDPSNEPHP